MQQLNSRGPRTTDNASDAAFDSFDEEAQQPDIQPVVDPKAPHDEHGHVPIPTGYANTTGHRLGVFVGLLATVLVIGFFTVQHLKNGEAASLRDDAALRVHEAPPVEIAIVGEAPATQTLVLPGETRGWYSSTIYARVTGYVAKWLVDIGDFVRKDQVMAVIDTPELDAQLQAARAQLQVSDAEAAVKEFGRGFGEDHLCTVADVAEGTRFRAGARRQESAIPRQHCPAQCRACPHQSGSRQRGPTYLFDEIQRGHRSL